MSPSISVGGTFEIPVFARIVKSAAVPRFTADLEGPPLSSLLESPLGSVASVASVVASAVSVVESPLALALASAPVLVGAELAPDVDPLDSAELDCVDASSTSFPHARTKHSERLPSGNS
jgi:hypothetical protein